MTLGRGAGAGLMPAVFTELLLKSGELFPIRMLIDSGAHCTTLPENFAGPLGIELADCTSLPVETGAGTIDHHVSKTPVLAYIAGRELELMPTFGPLRVPVLGREDFFREFKVAFDELKRRVVLKPYTDEEKRAAAESS